MAGIDDEDTRRTSNGYVGGARRSLHDWPRHPELDAYYERHEKLLHYWAHRIARRFKLDANDLVGTLYLHLNRVLHYYDPSRRFSTFFSYRVTDVVIVNWLRFESDAWGVHYAATSMTAEEKRECHSIYALHEADYSLYRVPEKDSDWTAAIIDCFDTIDEIWEFLCRDLNKRHRWILEKRFRDGMMLHECGKILRITKERTRQIEARALEKIRGRIRLVDAFVHLFRDEKDS